MDQAFMRDALELATERLASGRARPADVRPRARAPRPRRRVRARSRRGAEAQGDRDGELGRRRPQALLRRLGQALRDRHGHQGGGRWHRALCRQDARDGRGQERHLGRVRLRLRHLPRARQAGLLRRVRLLGRRPQEGAAGLRLQVGHRQLSVQLRPRLRQVEVRQQPAEELEGLLGREELPRQAHDAEGHPVAARDRADGRRRRLPTRRRSIRSTRSAPSTS